MAFANYDAQFRGQEDHTPLPELTEELDLIDKSLFPGFKNLHYLIHKDSTVTIDKVTDKLSELRDQVVLFHFGGHSDQRQLILTDKDANSDGIGRMLAFQRNLKLVFLNGCQNSAQVDCSCMKEYQPLSLLPEKSEMK